MVGSRSHGRLKGGFGEGDVGAYVGPQRRCLHLFISGQMLRVVEIERESWGGGGGRTSSIYSLIIHTGC